MPRPTDAEGKIADAALRLAARHGWSGLTLDQIARAAKLAPAAARKNFPDKKLVLAAVMRRIDAEAAAKFGTADSPATPHDRLFEAMMARFDVLQKHRAAVLSIADACRHDSALACLILPAQWKAMQKKLALARLAPTGMQKKAAALGLLGIYYRVLWCWRQDKTPDMAKTMAALDQALRLAGKAGEILFRNR